MTYLSRILTAVALLCLAQVLVSGLSYAPDWVVGSLVVPASTVIVLLSLRYPERILNRFHAKWLGPLLCALAVTLYVVASAWGESHFRNHVDWTLVLLETTIFFGLILRVLESYLHVEPSSPGSHELK